MTERKQMHLQDLFRTGKEVRFELDFEDDPVEIVIWMRKPTAGQQDEALNKARGKQARRKKAYRDKESDEYVSLLSDVESMEDVDELKTQIIRFDEAQLRAQAFNEVLHNEKYAPKDENGELLWGENNTGYLDLLTAIQQRMEEIQRFNSELEEEDQALRIEFETDEELVALQEDRDAFENHVTTRYEDLRQIELDKLKGQKGIQLRNQLLKKMIEAESSLVWYEEYRSWMLYFSCRKPEDKTKPYFDDPAQLMDMPTGVIIYLEDQLNDLDKSGPALKNLPSPLSSSDS